MSATQTEVQFRPPKLCMCAATRHRGSLDLPFKSVQLREEFPFGVVMCKENIRFRLTRILLIGGVANGRLALAPFFGVGEWWTHS